MGRMLLYGYDGSTRAASTVDRKQMAANDAESGDGDRDFDPSSLGTKEYWDAAYERENESFKDIGDVGEIWFGEDTMEKLLDWIDDCDDITENDAVIDLGCGNGMMCIELRKRGYERLTGVDYSELAVMLANSVAKSEGFDDIEFVSGDLVSDERPNPCTCLTRKYKLVFDKGTYDVISLMPGEFSTAQKKYITTVKSLMTPQSLFSLTSCNWSKDQLLAVFCEDFQLQTEIPFRTFQFGGKTGSTVTSLIFKLKS